MVHIHIPSLSMASLDLSLLPSTTPLFLSLLASLVVLATIRAVVLFLRPKFSIISQPQKQLIQLAQQPKLVVHDPSAPHAMSQRWSLAAWEKLPTLPISLKAPSTRRGPGVGLAQPPPPPSESQRNWRQGAPAFDRPLPALYQSDVPASMAKMIMSRHTFRKPTLRPPSQRSTTQIQISRRSPSMV